VTRTLVAALAACALVACSAPEATSCSQASDCAAGSVCVDGLCRVPIETTIVLGPESPVASSSATFQFEASVPGATFTCRIETEAVFTACSSPKFYSGLADGPHTFQVRAAVGEVAEAAPAEWSWSIDTTGPGTTLASTPAATQSEAPSFAFTSELGASFDCRLDGASFAACTSPKSYPAQTVGSHTFQVRARDALANIGPPESFTWTQAPETAITFAPLAATNRSSEKVAFSSTTVGATFECKLDGGLFSACTSPRTFAGLTNASHTVQVRALASGVYDPSPATTTFQVNTAAALLYYNFEGSGTNQGLLSGYAAVRSGAAEYSSARSHSATGLQSLRFLASYNGGNPLNRGSATLSGVRDVLSHDFDVADARYTIAFWYWEDSPINFMQGTLSPSVLEMRGGGGGFETYHGASGGGLWYTCVSTTPAGGGCDNGSNGAAATWHRMVIEYGPSGTTAGAYELKHYLDATPLSTITTAVGASIFNSSITDPTLGTDTSMYIDDLKIWNERMGSNPP
jgi:hypothetical protein